MLYTAERKKFLRNRVGKLPAVNNDANKPGQRGKPNQRLRPLSRRPGPGPVVQADTLHTEQSLVPFHGVFGGPFDPSKLNTATRPNPRQRDKS